MLQRLVRWGIVWGVIIGVGLVCLGILFRMFHGDTMMDNLVLPAIIMPMVIVIGAHVIAAVAPPTEAK